MRNKIGTAFMILGTALVAAALALFLHNSFEQNQAGESVNELMPLIVEAINTRQETEPEEDTAQQTLPSSVLPAEPEIREMTTVEINGYGYIGFVALPSLGLELPVMADWTYAQLKTAPCRYTGSLFSDDLVIMAHNYSRHFGHLKELKIGDTVTFTDMDGGTTEYEVVALDVLDPYAVEEMTAGEYDLTLFTCTYGGQSRVTVRCDKVNE